MPVVVISLAATLPYVSTWSDPFIADDWLHLASSASMAPSDLPSVFAFPQSDIFYRPVSVVYFWLNYQLWGLDPVGHHVVKGLLFALSAVLLYLLVLRLTNRKIPALCAGLVFALHPLNACCAVWIATHANILCILFYLAALILFVEAKRRKSKPLYGAFLLSALLCLGSYELGYSLPLAVLLMDFLLLKSPAQEKFTRRLLWHLPYIAIGIAFLVARFTLMGHGYGEPRPWMETLQCAVAQTTEMLFLPVGRTALPLSLPLRMLPALIGGLLALWVFWHGKDLRRLVIFALALAAIGLIPAKDVAMAAREIHTSRFLIVSMAGFALLLGVFVEYFRRNKIGKIVVPALALALLAACMPLDRATAENWSAAARDNRAVLNKIRMTCEDSPFTYKLIFLHRPPVRDTVPIYPDMHIIALSVLYYSPAELRSGEPYSPYRNSDLAQDYAANPMMNEFATHLLPLYLDESRADWERGPYGGFSFESNRLSAANLDNAYFFYWNEFEGRLNEYTQAMRARLSQQRTTALPVWGASDETRMHTKNLNAWFNYDPADKTLILAPLPDKCPGIKIDLAGLKASDFDYLTVVVAAVDPEYLYKEASIDILWLWADESESPFWWCDILHEPYQKFAVLNHCYFVEMNIPLAQYLCEYGDREIANLYITFDPNIARYCIKDIRLGRYCDESTAPD